MLTSVSSRIDVHSYDLPGSTLPGRLSPIILHSSISSFHVLYTHTQYNNYPKPWKKTSVSLMDWMMAYDQYAPVSFFQNRVLLPFPPCFPSVLSDGLPPSRFFHRPLSSVFFFQFCSSLFVPLFLRCAAQALMAAVAQQPVSIAIEADEVRRGKQVLIDLIVAHGSR